MTDAFKLPIRVYYEDTDAGGIVYHASYLRFGERGRTEMLRGAGFEHARLLKEEGLAFAVVALNIEYKAPAQIDDLLMLHSRVTRMGGASIDIEQIFYRDDKIICEIKVVIVCIDQSMKAVRLPDKLRQLFKSET